jgi:AcrR family transcriptional regulator
MTDDVLTPEEILTTAEDVLRRYGPGKATVVDVARALGVSHGSVYRHFSSKAELRDAVAERWLKRIAEPLEKIASQSGPAPQRLEAWIRLLVKSKHSRALDDPELFATYITLVNDARDVVQAHVASLVGQLTRIIQDGIQQDVFHVEDASKTARAIFDATTRFHNPIHAQEWTDSSNKAAFENVLKLLMRSLMATASP